MTLSAVIRSLSNCSDQSHLRSPHTFDQGLYLSSGWALLLSYALGVSAADFVPGML